MLAANPYTPANLRLAALVARRVARATGRSGPDVDDLAQAAALDLEDAVQAWDPSRAALSTWLGSRLASAALREHRRLRGPGPGRLRRAAAEIWHHDPYAELEDAREQVLQLTAVMRALESLPRADREVFLRHYRDGEPCRVLAAERGVTQQAVSERLRRMLGQVQRAVGTEPGRRLFGTKEARRCRAERVAGRRHT